MKILHSSDWHIGRFLGSFSLLDDQAHFLGWLLEVLKSEKIDLLVVSGDIYNTAAPSSAAVAVFDEFLTKVVLELKIKVALISGNHDSAEKLGFSSRILRQSGLFVAGGLQGMQRLDLNFDCGRVQLCLLPFFSYLEARQFFKLPKNCSEVEVIEKILERFNFNESSYVFKLLSAHGLFVYDGDGKKLSYCDSELVGGSEFFNLALFEDFDYVALGHLHGPQKAGNNGFYCGSPLKYSISEANQKKRVVVVDVSKNGFKTESIFVEPLHDLWVLTGRFDDFLSLKTNDYISFRLTDESFVLSPYARLRVGCPNILELEYVNLNFNVSNELSKFKRVEPGSLFEKFYAGVVGRSMNEIEKKIFSEVVEGLKKNEVN